MTGEWLVDIVYDVTTNAHALFIRRQTSKSPRQFDVFGNPGVAGVETVTPTLQFLEPEMLTGLANALARIGFGQVATAPVLKAQQDHIASLEKQADRLYVLAGRVP
jgi:hypothetical protein